MIVNADDFGFTPAVTQGIVEAHEAGSVTATTMLVRQPGWDHAVRAARATPSLDIGLHFNALVGAPLVAATSLTDRRTGRFLPLPSLVVRALRGGVDAAEVEAECEAQFAELRAAGIAPTHIDSHRHTHALPGLRAAVARVAVRHGVALRRPLESPRWFPLDLAAQLHRGVVQLAWRSTAPRRAEARSTDHFVGISLQGGTRFDERLDVVLASLPHGATELMVHVGHADDALRA
ncbi:MAG: ChbG/HpnK family deacetylase, partial [Gemmatimonadetes bacterium]|nr:ChbG/HpnK family deacetylase [Gemmatimonadota bacterium]